MTTYTFDLNLTATVHVESNDPHTALRIVQERFEGASCNGGAWVDGSPILFEASLSQRPTLIGADDHDSCSAVTLNDWADLPISIPAALDYFNAWMAQHGTPATVLSVTANNAQQRVAIRYIDAPGADVVVIRNPSGALTFYDNPY